MNFFEKKKKKYSKLSPPRTYKYKKTSNKRTDNIFQEQVRNKNRKKAFDALEVRSIKSFTVLNSGKPLKRKIRMPKETVKLALYIP